MVRQLVISNMIKGDDAKASAKASEIYAAHVEDISKLPAAIRLQILGLTKSNTMKAKN